MGHSTYSAVDRHARVSSMSDVTSYYTASSDAIFTQSAERKAHKDMNSRNIDIREARDSEAHPNTFPVQVYLDVTGSMGHIPHNLIKEGLPKMVSKIIQSGTPDIALLFGAIGDHECDNFPLQVSQFESGDEELDMWLTRSYLEGGGGGNMGESYPLAWYFAANHVETDHKDKRGGKGVVITIGDEPFLKHYPQSAIKQMMGDTCRAESTVSAEELFDQATKDNEVYHIFLEHGYRRCDPAWKQLMGDNLRIVKDYTEIPDVIAELVTKNSRQVTKEDISNLASTMTILDSKEIEIIL